MTSPQNKATGVAALSLGVAFLFYLIAFASPYWLENHGYNLGLWTTCYLDQSPQPTSGTVNDTTASSADVDEWHCASTNHWIYDVNAHLEASWLSGFQAMAVLGFVLSLVVVGCLLVYCLLPFNADNRSVSLGLIYAVTLAAFATGCFSMLSVIICGSTPHDDTTAVHRASLSWSFYLALVANILVWIGCGLSFYQFARCITGSHT